MKKVIIAAIALFSLASCNVFEMPQTQMPTLDEGYGYLDLGITSDSEMQVVTKAATTVGGDELNACNITITGGALENPITGEYADVFEGGSLKLAKGTYTIAVENLTDAEAHPADVAGSMRYTGTNSSIVVEAGVTNSYKIDCTPANSKVTVEFTEAFNAVFKSVNYLEVASINEEGADIRKVVMINNSSEPAVNVTEVFFPATSKIRWALKATNNNDVEKNYAIEAGKEFTTAAAGCSNIKFDVSSTEGYISISVEVNGEYSEPVDVPAVLDPMQ